MIARGELIPAAVIYDPPEVFDRLRELGVIGADVPDERISAEPLTGGVSARIHRIRWDHDEAVAKQALPELAVEATWESDPARVGREVACIRTLRDSLTDNAWVPRIRAADLDNHAYVMDAAPATARNWKDVLLAGEVDLDIIRRIAQILVLIHDCPLSDAEQAVFEDAEAFNELRIDPFYAEVCRRYPELADVVGGAADDLLRGRRALVHGDYSPKNILVWDDGLMILDYEVAHLGDPAFDIAFMISHLVLTALSIPEHCERILTAVDAFWSEYARSSTDTDLEQRVVRHLGCLLLARIDGKSPVDHLPSAHSRAVTRDLAREIIQGRHTTVEAAADLVTKAIKEQLR